MALFTDTEPDPVRPRRGGGWIGWILLAAALIGVTVVALLPAPYVIEQPGPVFDVLGDVQVDGEAVPMIQIPMEETFPTEGSLDMLTVNIRGNPDNLPTWLDIATAYFDPSRAILPVDTVYPPGTTVETSNEQSRIDMENSQKEAIAAAMTNLGYEVPSTLSVIETTPGGPAQDVLLPDDVIVSVNGEVPADVTALRALIADNGTDGPAEVVVDRAGEEQTFEITPTLSEGDNPAPIIGIIVGSDYDFPFSVKIQLENVGGPSAGMMFALGIIDKLTEGPLNGGEVVAGTGTISSTGEVGPIGGIVQKMWGAVREGHADWFLAPAANCTEVVGNIPPGLTVFAVEDLDDALTALAAIRSDGDTTGLPTCTAD
ncbi:YlbL family protein [Salinibacterium soli]|uniref:endopeptidase La n=1 Tax=Antiquaquibacter soli TaxID=3064523 RepID=A0ABT9BPK5_9MICO|nr:S16 family serine protease [Protaetiibacter sp. WY-16]MDO7881350.1 S16 family serine protease [Protaetiibacter sp. WY-16]